MRRAPAPRRGIAPAPGRRPPRPSRHRRASLVALLLLALIAGACGQGEEEAPPRGPAAERHGERAVAALTRAEDVRARLVAASDLYGLRAVEDARGHLAAARATYAPLSPRIGARDRRLDVEISRAFSLVDARMRRKASPARVEEPINLITGQLLDGALDLLLAPAARADPGVRAEALRRTSSALARRFAKGSGPGGGRGTRRARQHAYGLLARSQILARGLSGALGPERDPVVFALGSIRFEAYPLGLSPRPPTGAVVGDPPRATPAPPPAARVAALTGAVRAALERRFALGD